MSWVTDRSAVRYLRPGEAFDALGVRVYVLGPPRDRALIRRSDPSTVASEVYELAADGGALGFSAALLGPETATTADLAPFDPSLALDETSARRHPLIGEVYEDEPQAWRRIDRDWLDTADDLALKLDSDTNNTSLVLALELGAGGPVLLFPGDAQVGNWLSWGALEWTTGTGRVHARDLLARTRLYKVGHHGSHNATLRAEGLELMPSDELVAMIPVDRVTAQKQRWNMPLPSLLHRLEEKTRGRILDAELGRPQRRPDALGADEWATFLDRTDVAPRWVDYTLPW